MVEQIIFHVNEMFSNPFEKEFHQSVEIFIHQRANDVVEFDQGLR